MRPAIIIGAPRSGTNVLRDVLTSMPDAVTWPCDEINPIWRHGNVGFPHDQLPPSRATPGVQRYLRNQFEKIARRQKGELVVEKTCANSLRVDFVDRVFPDAVYLFIVRDGIDAIASAMDRWTAPFDLGYTLRKLRYVPVIDLPSYASRFLVNRLHRLSSDDRRLATWGPVFAGMRTAATELPLAEVCALQWQACVRRAEESFATMDPQRVFRLEYEEFATEPARMVARICDFLGLSVDTETIESAARVVRSDSIGKGRDRLSDDQLRRIERRLASS